MTVTIGPAGRSYTLPVNSFTNAASGTVISPSDANASHIDIAAGINTALAYAAIDGQRRRMGIQDYTATPPGSPSDGQVWLVNTGGTGVFAGKDKKFAVFLSASWLFFDPVAGDEAVIVATRQGLVYDAAGVWRPGPAVPLSSTTVGLLLRITDTVGGVGQSQMSEDGSGNVSISGNLSATGAAKRFLADFSNATISNRLAFQTTATNGATHVGMLPNGTGTASSFRVFNNSDPTNSAYGQMLANAGQVVLTSGILGTGTAVPLAINVGGADRLIFNTDGSITGNIREKLLANRTYYVRPDGSDSNTGLANTAGGAFLTLAKAGATVQSLDLSTFNVTVQVADGTYAAGVSVVGPLVGAGGTLSFVGNTTTPANVIIAGSGITCFQASGGASFSVSGFEVRGSVGLFATQNGTISVGAAMRFGAASAYQIYVMSGGAVTLGNNYSIVGSAIAHINMDGGGRLTGTSLTITLTGTPAFTAFAFVGGVSNCVYYLNTFSGSATGQRYNISGNSVLNVNGAPTTSLPGSTAGATSSGGQYI